MTGLRSSELAAIFVLERRINLSVVSESCLSPSAFGATEVTFRTGQFLRVPRGLRTINDDTSDDRRVLVDDDLDSGVVVVDGFNGGSGGHGECVTDVSCESPLLNRRELSITHSTFRTFRLYDVKITLERKMISEQSSRAYRCCE